MSEIIVSDESLAKIFRVIQNNSGITINEIIGITDFSDTYINVALRELRAMGCVISDRTGGPRNKAFYNATNHNCYYCRS